MDSSKFQFHQNRSSSFSDMLSAIAVAIGLIHISQSAGGHFGKMPKMSLKSSFANVSESISFQGVKWYHCAKFGACSKKCTI